MPETFTTYREAKQYLEEGRDPDHRSIAHETSIETRGDDIALRYHATDVVTWHPDGSITLESNGWHTVTTKKRMNDFQALVWVFQEDYEWYISFRSYPRDDSDAIPYEDGMKIYPDGTIE